MARLRLFAAAREAAGTGRDTIEGETVGEVLATARVRYGARFGEVLDASRVWLNGEPAEPSLPVGPDDEVAVLPPVSGGATAEAPARNPGRPAIAGRAQSGAARSRGGTKRSARTKGDKAERDAPLGLAPPLSDDLPHGRLGALWLLITVPLVVAGGLPLLVWLGLHAAVAGAQMATSWRRAGRQVSPAGAAAGAFVAVAGFGAGPIAGLATLVVGAAAAAWMSAMMPSGSGRGRPRKAAPGPAAWCAVVPAVAAGALIAARGSGVASGLVLVLLVAAWDGANYIMGTGARWRWVGPAAGAATVVIVTVGAAAIGSPPVAGSTAWVLGGAVAVLAPVGPRVATLACGDRRARLSALRRLDSLLVTGPAWWILVHALPGR